MRKLFSLIAAVLFAGSMMATTVTKTVEELATANSWENSAVVTPFNFDDVISVATEATDANTGKYYTNGQQIRLYQTGSAKMIISAADGYTISSITLEYASQNGGIFAEAASGVAVPFENVQSATFTVTNSGDATNGQARVTSFSVTYAAAGGEVPQTAADTLQAYIADMILIREFIATFSPQAASSFDGYISGYQQVLQSENVELIRKAIAEIDQQRPTFISMVLSLGKEALNTTLQALLQDGDSEECQQIISNAQAAINAINWDDSKSVEQNLTYLQNEGTRIYNDAVAALDRARNPLTPITCLEVYQKAKNDTVLLNPVTVTYSNGANVWVMDGSASMLIYLPSGFTNNFKAGDVLTGVAGVVDIYQNIVYEVKPDATQAAAITVTSGEAPAPSQAAVIEASDVNKYVILPGFSIKGAFTADSKTSLPAALGTDTVTIYNNFKFAYTFEAGKTYNITGVVSAYKGNPQVYFISAEEAGGDVPPTPSINYYVAGSMNGWAADAAYMLTPNNENLYQGEFTFAANDEFKVIGVEGETTTWFPGGMDNNFKITEAGDYKITFNPAGNVDGWYAGYFNVVKKQIIQYEVAQAISAGIPDGTEIMVRGIITKMEFKGANFAKFGSVNIYVADVNGAEGEFEFFNCFSLNADTFRTSIPNYDPTDKNWAQFREVADANGNAIHVGDTVIAFGEYLYYQQKSIYELNTGCYLVDIKSAPVPPAQDINVNMSEGLFYNDYVADEGWWQIYGSNEKFDVSISNVETTQAEGTYTINDLDADYTYVGVINGNDTNYVSFVDGSVTLSIDAQTDAVTIAGTLVGDDGNNYIFNLQFIVPKPTETVNVNIQNAELIDYYVDYGLYGVYGTDANDIYVQIAIWTETFEGNFTETDLDVQYIGSGIFEGEEQVNIYTAAITVTPGNGGDYNITATLLCYNNKQYNVTMYVPAGEMAIENVDAAIKAIKRLVNGNLIIEKGNKTYNVNGTVIR